MSEIKFSIISRFSQFWSNLRKENFRSKQSLINWLSWLISLLILAISLSLLDYKSYQIFLLIHLVFLFKFLGYIHQRILPPTELLLIFLYFLFLILKGILGVAYTGLELQKPGALLFILQFLLLGLLVLIFSSILVHNSNGRRRIIIWFAILGIIGHYILIGGNDYLIFFFQVILLLSLLHKTKWLEELTKTECWVYLMLVFFFTRLVYNLNPFSAYSPISFTQVITWYSLPYFLYLLFKLYLTAVLIKIPVVLIYNHARLSRKLWISGLFQSTFPQFIQLISLLLIFYFFLSGWQAGNLRDSMQNQLEQIQNINPEPSLQYYKIVSKDRNVAIELEDYEPVFSLHRLPERCILQMKPRRPNNILSDTNIDYFLFAKSSIADSHFIYLIKVDSSFLKIVSENLRFIAGTSMLVYPFSPSKWASYIYEMDFIVQSDRYVKIFPFSILAHDEIVPISIALESEGNGSKLSKTKVSFQTFGKWHFTFGRVFLPLWESNSTSKSYFAFDIVLDAEPKLLWSGLGQIMLFMIVIYILFNSFVIRQVVKFGSQINKMIVQKFNQLKNGIQEISTGNLDYKIRLEGEDEFVELANRFNEMGDRLKQNIAEAREKDRLKYELQIAREVQLSLLPAKLPEIAGFQISASLKTANEVGGDFYDILPLENNRFLLTIGDVSGKGSSAAFYMAQCMSLVRFLRQLTAEPNEISSKLNDYFAASVTDRRIFVTAIVGILDVNSNTLQFVRAGHTEPLFIPGNKNDEIKFLKTKGIGIGLTKNSQFFENSLESTKISFEEGDILLLYTDGVIEAARRHPDNFDINAEMELFSEERLIALLERIRENNAEQILHELEIELESFYAGFPRVDDHTLLIIQRSKPID